jgi:hypothetical protein
VIQRDNPALLLCTFIFPAFFLLTGCGKPAPDPAKALVGKHVTIQFRRDALGGAATLPVSPFTTNINGADTSASGKVERVEGNWLVIKRGGNLAWIPREVILAIEEPDTRKQ